MEIIVYSGQEKYDIPMVPAGDAELSGIVLNLPHYSVESTPRILFEVEIAIEPRLP